MTLNAIERKEATSCYGKIPYKNRQSAWAAVRYSGFDRSTVEVYQCEFCKQWHFGHPITPKNGRRYKK